MASEQVITLDPAGPITGAEELHLVQAGESVRTLVSTITNYVVAQIVNNSPEALNTLDEFATALNNDPNFATTILNILAGKQDALSLISQADAEAGTETAIQGWSALRIAQAIAAQASGGIGQTLYTSRNDRVSYGANAWHTMMTLSVTPTSENSRFLIDALPWAGGRAGIGGRLTRNGSMIASAVNNPYNTSYPMGAQAISMLDTPNTASPITYDIDLRSNLNSFWLNRQSDNRNGAVYAGSSGHTHGTSGIRSTFRIIEIL